MMKYLGYGSDILNVRSSILKQIRFFRLSTWLDPTASLTQLDLDWMQSTVLPMEVSLLSISRHS